MAKENEPLDKVYVAVGMWGDVMQFWRGGVFDTPEEAEHEFRENTHGKFVGVRSLVIE